MHLFSIILTPTNKDEENFDTDYVLKLNLDRNLLAWAVTVVIINATKYTFKRTNEFYTRNCDSKIVVLQRECARQVDDIFLYLE